MSKATYKALICNFGGTIGMVPDAKGHLRPPETDTEFRSAVEEIALQFGAVDFDFVTLSTKDSTDLGPADWQVLTDFLFQRQKDYDFIVIPHGTDSMAVTAAAVPYGFLAEERGTGRIVNTLQTPLIFTGAQRPIAQIGSDGVPNLTHAIVAGMRAADLDIADSLIVFNDKVIRGIYSLKVSDINRDAFHSVNGTYAGRILDGENPLSSVDLDTKYVRRLYTDRRAELDNMDMQDFRRLNGFTIPGQGYLHRMVLDAGIKPFALDALAADPRCLGIVMTTLGTGNVPSSLESAVRSNIRDYHLPVFAVSPFIGGSANPRAYAAGAWAFEAGVTFLREKSPNLVWVAAHWLIAGGLAETAEQFSRNMQKNWHWEPYTQEEIMIPPVLNQPASSPMQAYETRLTQVKSEAMLANPHESR